MILLESETRTLTNRGELSRNSIDVANSYVRSPYLHQMDAERGVRSNRSDCE